MGFIGRAAGFALLMAVCAANPAAAQSDPPAATAQAPLSFVPADFAVPTLIEGPGFRLVPLGPALVKVDFDAYMSSIEHLQQTFTRSAAWPHAGLSDADAMQDMNMEQARFQGRKSFAYAVLTPDGSRERGSVYVSPSPVPGYDAVVRLWVTKAEYDAGFDAQLYAWVQIWVAKDWPFAKVAYPGRAIAWDEWDAAVAGLRAKAPGG
ncbi:twin-arginine translocation pathway signal protein [Novosphingobium sp. ERN07]|uniref:twin-arginine translocation pathway signal protein n=1 Tax=Novosphingobium sp. ERN07 TaxID=2726187 RepID=UPI0014578388|nr:twin-arginine translocation pathway signal protein [Novosphingobium sp. ERN07]NLR70510.1 twin-arginine translocation pathway signal protein [Novosphingobium sp. ERN07]